MGPIYHFSIKRNPKYLVSFFFLNVNTSDDILERNCLALEPQFVERRNLAEQEFKEFKSTVTGGFNSRGVVLNVAYKIQRNYEAICVKGVKIGSN